MSYDVDDKMVERFAERAKRLMYGMRKRWHRDQMWRISFLPFETS